MDRKTDMLAGPETRDEEVIACLLSKRQAAIRGEELAAGLFAQVEAVEELPGGFGDRFAQAETRVLALLDFNAAERRCCPFLSLELAFEAHGGPLWLRLRGSPRVKAFIAETFTTRVVGTRR